MNKCSRCGTDNNYNAQFCRGCGVVLVGKQGAATVPFKRHNALLIGLGIGVGIVVLVVIGLLFFLPPQNPLVGKWQDTDDTLDGMIVSLSADGTLKIIGAGSDDSEFSNLTYKTHDDLAQLYKNGEFIGSGQYSINGGTLTLKYLGNETTFKRIE